MQTEREHEITLRARVKLLLEKYPNFAQIKVEEPELQEKIINLTRNAEKLAISRLSEIHRGTLVVETDGKVYAILFENIPATKIYSMRTEKNFMYPEAAVALVGANVAYRSQKVNQDWIEEAEEFFEREKPLD